jgi:hypothetical protein
MVVGYLGVVATSVYAQAAQPCALDIGGGYKIIWNDQATPERVKTLLAGAVDDFNRTHPSIDEQLAYLEKQMANLADYSECLVNTNRGITPRPDQTLQDREAIYDVYVCSDRLPGDRCRPVVIGRTNHP